MTQKKLERIIYVVVAIVVVVRFFYAYQHQKELLTADYQPSAIPPFTWRDFSSNQHTLKEIEGKTIVLHFWASWCAPCRSEFPSLLQAAKFLENDVVFLTISGDEDDIPVKKFLLNAKIEAGVRPDNVLYGFDPMKQVIFDVFQSSALPESIIIDPAHTMRRKLLGAQNWQDPKLISYLRDLKNNPLTPEVPKP